MRGTLVEVDTLGEIVPWNVCDLCKKYAWNMNGLCMECVESTWNGACVSTPWRVCRRLAEEASFSLVVWISDGFESHFGRIGSPPRPLWEHLCAPFAPCGAAVCFFRFFPQFFAPNQEALFLRRFQVFFDTMQT